MGGAQSPQDGKPGEWNRPWKGTPQGGVISPLLSNLFLHWFDKLFHRADGPARPYRPPEGVSYYEHIQPLGLIRL